MLLEQFQWVSATPDFVIPQLTQGLASYVVEPVEIGLYRHRLQVDETFTAGLDYSSMDQYDALYLTLPRMNADDDANLIRNNLAVMLQLHYGLSIDFYEEYADTAGGWTLIPFHGDNPIYLSRLEIVALQTCLEIDLLLDYVPVETTNTSLAYLTEWSLLLRECQGVIFCPRDVLDDLQQQLQIWQSWGLVAVTTNQYEGVLLRELAQLWELTIRIQVGDGDDLRFGLTTETDLGMPLNVWLRRALLDVQLDRLPAVWYYTDDVKAALSRYKEIAPAAYHADVLITDEGLLFRLGSAAQLRLMGGAKSLTSRQAISQPLQLVADGHELTLNDQVIGSLPNLQFQLLLESDGQLASELLNQHARAYLREFGQLPQYPLRDRINLENVLALAQLARSPSIDQPGSPSALATRN